MKRILVSMLLLVMLNTFAESELLPLRTGPLNFPSAVPGIICSSATRAMYREAKVDLNQYEVLGKVQSEAEMSNVLLLFNFGDTSLATLKAKALEKYPEADDIVNIEIDCHSYNFLVIYIGQTVMLRGVAVKYKK